MNLSRESAEFISIICRRIKPEKVLEIGTFNGYSALWLSLFSKKVITLEIDEKNIELALKNFKKAENRNIEIISGDAKESLKKLKYKFDIIFIDAKKSEYKDYLELSLKLLDKNGVIFVDNTISHKESLKEFFNYLEKSSLYYRELNLGKGLIIIGNKVF